MLPNDRLGSFSPNGNVPDALGMSALLRGIIAQRLNLEQQIDHMASKLCILGFEPLESLIRRQPYRYESM
jgi:hypothetical protein